MTGKLLKNPIYVRVKTDEVHPDMTRYMSYDKMPETARPQQVKYSAGDTPFLHRFQRDGYTYFMRPTIFNAVWEIHAVERYASFGIKADICKYDDL